MIPFALALLSLAGACFVARLVRGPSLADRIVALDGLVVTVVAVIVVDAVGRRSAIFLDVAVVVAFVGFVGTAAAARFVEQRGA